MQPGRWRRHGPALARKHRLVALSVVRTIRSLDVRRQRHVTDRVDRGVDRRRVLRPETNDAAAVETKFENLALQRMCAVETHPGSCTQPLPRMHQGLPQLAIARLCGRLLLDSSNQEALDLASAGEAA